ncbi:MAG: GNAT family N-acetyltransferase [Bacteroidota bacterium]
MKAFLQIETDRGLIRRLKPADKPKFLDLMMDKSVTDNMAFSDDMKTQAGAKQILEMTLNAYETKEPLLAFAIEEKDSSEFLGLCGGTIRKPGEMEIFYAFLPEQWGRGWATEVLRGLTTHVFLNRDIHLLQLFITPNNRASQRVAEKNNFIKQGWSDHPQFEEKVLLFEKSKS